MTGTSEDTRRAPVIQSVARASRILLGIAASDAGLTAKEVAAAHGLTLPTTYHLLTTLAEEGLVAKDERRRFVLGPRVALLADALMRDTVVPDAELKLLRRLAETTGETAYLSAWRRGEIRVLATVEGAHAVRVGEIARGFFGDAHARATGKLLLAFAQPAMRDALLATRNLRRLTPATLTTVSELEREFEAIRAGGIAFDREEFMPGVSCVSAPVWLGDVVAAAFTVSAPSPRFEQNEAQYVEATRRTARAASSRD